MKYKCLIPIASIFVATLLISNTLDTKIFHFLGLDLPAGIILFPLAYLAGDLLSEVYGYAVARRIIWSGLFALVLMIFTYEIAMALPPASFWENQAAFDSIFSHIPRLVIASIIAYLCGEFVNSYTVAKMKVAMNGRAMGFRFVLSTVFGQAVDTGLWVLIALGGTLPVASLLSITLSAWLVKVGWEIVALPFTLVVARWLKRVEGEDHYDRGTNFSPFHV